MPFTARCWMRQPNAATQAWRGIRTKPFQKAHRAASLTKVKRFFEDFHYQAASWDKERRVITKIEWHPGELLPPITFIVTNPPMGPDWVVRVYIQRGTSEQHITESKYAFN